MLASRTGRQCFRDWERPVLIYRKSSGVDLKLGISDPFRPIVDFLCKLEEYEPTEHIWAGYVPTDEELWDGGVDREEIALFQGFRAFWELYQTIFMFP